MLNHDPAAKTHDRIGFTMTMAIAFHVAVILGVGFMLQVPKAPSGTRMDITLSNYRSDKTILDADFIAQTNQEASGSESHKKELTTTELAPINSSEIKQFSPEIAIPKNQAAAQSMQVVSSTEKSARKAAEAQPESEKQAEELRGEVEQLKREIEMASLQAKLDKDQQVFARQPRLRRASSVATKAAEDAEYLYHWQQRIEAIGNEHYPRDARKQKLYGSVEVLVRIDASGTLQSAEILNSSGIKILDDAALKIVRLASPYAPFPAEMKRDIDILEIVRTWEFKKDRFGRQLQ